MIRFRFWAIALLLVLSANPSWAAAPVQVIGEMRKMFMAHDIGANVDLAKISAEQPHLYGLGPVAGLKGEVTVLDGQVLVSGVNDGKPIVTTDPKAKAVFLVYASVPAWQTISIPTNVVSESELAAFLKTQIRMNTRSAFRVRGTARQAHYHIQDYQGEAKDLTHEAHDQAKVFFEITDQPVELVGFHTDLEDDGGSFVHQGQTTHIHVVSVDRKHMGHLESITLAPGATLFLPDPEPEP